MTLFGPDAIGCRITEIRNDALTPNVRGKALEGLASDLFSAIPGVDVIATNSMDVFACQEIDVVLWNVGSSQGLIGFDKEILVECKNWSTPVGALEVAWFDTKLRTRGMRHGFLLAMNGITGQHQSRTSAHAIIAIALAERRRIVVLKAEELKEIKTSDDLVQLCRRRMHSLLTTRGLPD